jgi:toxin ParE1/3/4
MAYRVLLSPRVRDQLEAIHDYIAEAAGPATAERFTDALLDRIEALSELPMRGVPRDDLAPGLRTLSFRGRVTIAFGVDGDLVLVSGVFYGGQDFETLLRED